MSLTTGKACTCGIQVFYDVFFVLPPADNLMGGHLKLWLPRGSVLLPQEGQDFVA